MKTYLLNQTVQIPLSVNEKGEPTDWKAFPVFGNVVLISSVFRPEVPLLGEKEEKCSE